MSFTKFTAKKMMTSLVSIGALIAVVGSANPGLEVTAVKMQSDSIPSDRSVELQDEPQNPLENVRLQEFVSAHAKKFKRQVKAGLKEFQSKLPTKREAFENWKDGMTDKEKLWNNAWGAAKMTAKGAYYISGAHHLRNAGGMAHEKVLRPLGKKADEAWTKAGKAFEEKIVNPAFEDFIDPLAKKAQKTWIEHPDLHKPVGCIACAGGSILLYLGLATGGLAIVVALLFLVAGGILCPGCGNVQNAEL